MNSVLELNLRRPRSNILQKTSTKLQDDRQIPPEGNILVLAAVVLHEGGGDIDMEVGPLVLAGLLEHSPGSLVQNFNIIH